MTKKMLLAQTYCFSDKMKTYCPLTINSVVISYFHPIYMYKKYVEHIKLKQVLLKRSIKMLTKKGWLT